MSMNESKLWTFIKQSQKTHKNWHFFRLESHTINGIPDVYGCIKSQSFWIELKATHVENRGLSKWQWNWHIDHIRAGGKSYILNANDKESCYEILVIREPRAMVLVKSYPYDHNHNHIATITEILITMSQP